MRRATFLLTLLASVAPAAIALAQDAPAAAPSTTVEGVTVRGHRPDFRSSIDRRSYSVANDLQAETGSVADVLRNVPSVEVDLQGNVSLRGDSSVTILVDGKPSGMFEGEGRGDALQQLPADQIDRIEVLTNPSAAFRPDGTAGIINLVSKRNQLPGTSGSVRANVGLEGRYNLGGSINRRFGKWTVSVDAGYRHDKQEGGTESVRETLDPVSDQFIESRQSVVTTGDRDGVNARASVAYDFDRDTRVTAEARHRAMTADGATVESYEGDDATGNTVFAYDRFADTTFERTNTEASLSYLRKFSGDQHQLTVDLTRERTDNDRATSARSETTLPAPLIGFQDTRSSTDQDRTDLKADYNRPFASGARLQTGFEIERTENTYDNFGAAGLAPEALVVDPALTNLFLYDQTISSAYATWEQPFGRFAAQAGLRLEQVNIDTNQVTTGQQNAQDYFKAYPTLHLRYELSDTQQLTASYSKRVQRPRAESLNPYPLFIDPFNYRVGNPLLEPQETDSYEIGWQRRAGQTYYLATVYYRDTSNAFTGVVQDLGNGVLLTTTENLGSSRSAGLELVANGRLLPKLSYNVSTNVFWQEIDASNLGFSEPRSGTSVSGRGSLNWQATDKDFFQISGFMRGDRVLPQGVQKSSGMLNLGYRRKVNDQFSLVVTAQNVLDTFRDEVVIDTPAFRSDTVREMRAGRAVFVGLTWSFGGQGPRRQRGERPQDFEFDADDPAG